VDVDGDPLARQRLELLPRPRARLVDFPANLERPRVERLMGRRARGEDREADEIATSSWALRELVEAAVRSGRHEVARESLDQLRERTDAGGTSWAEGTRTRGTTPA
jgi:hypothetical protein